MFVHPIQGFACPNLETWSDWSPWKSSPERISRTDWPAGPTGRWVNNFGPRTTVSNLWVNVLVQTSEDGIGTDLMVFSKGFALPVCSCTHLLWFCPVKHAAFLTITQRHLERERLGGEETRIMCQWEFRLMTSNNFRFVLRLFVWNCIYFFRVFHWTSNTSTMPKSAKKRKDKAADFTVFLFFFKCSLFFFWLNTNRKPDWN